LSSLYLKDATDPSWRDDAGFKAWSAFMDSYYPDGDRSDGNTVYGYLAAQTLVQVLKQCGDDLTRENVMKQAANLRDLKLDMLLPGIAINTRATDFYPIKQMQMTKFNGEHWERIGPVVSGEIGG
jgi:branched-chain amino acid transport system substrate-binding protein